MCHKPNVFKFQWETNIHVKWIQIPQREPKSTWNEFNIPHEIKFRQGRGVQVPLGKKIQHPFFPLEQPLTLNIFLHNLQVTIWSFVNSTLPILNKLHITWTSCLNILYYITNSKQFYNKFQQMFLREASLRVDIKFD